MAKQTITFTETEIGYTTTAFIYIDDGICIASMTPNPFSIDIQKKIEPENFKIPINEENIYGIVGEVLYRFTLADIVIDLLQDTGCTYHYVFRNRKLLRRQDLNIFHDIGYDNLDNEFLKMTYWNIK